MHLQFFREYAPLCILKEYGLLGRKGTNGPDRIGSDFRSADRFLFIIIKELLFFLFSPLGFLRRTEPRGKSSQLEKHLPFQS